MSIFRSQFSPEKNNLMASALMAGPQKKKWDSIVAKQERSNLPKKSSQTKFEDLPYSSQIELKLRDIAYPLQEKNNEIINENYKQNELMKIYNEKLAKKYEELEKNKPQGLIPDKILFDGPHRPLHKLVMSSEEISPLLRALEDENILLKGEVKVLSGDLATFMEWVQLLIEENKFIRDHINRKNE